MKKIGLNKMQPSINSPLPATYIRRILLNLGILLTFFLIITSSALAQGTTRLHCRVENDRILPDEVTKLVIEVTDIQNLFGYQLKLNFPAGFVEAVDEDPNQEGVNLALGTFLSPDFVVLNHADNANGVISLAMVQINPAPPKSGAGELASVHMRGKTPGRVDFVFNEVILSNSSAEAIPHNLEGCTLQVVDSSLPAPTEVVTISTEDEPTEEQPTPIPASDKGNGATWSIPALVIGMTILASIWLISNHARKSQNSRKD